MRQPTRRLTFATASVAGISLCLVTATAAADDSISVPATATSVAAVRGALLSASEATFVRASIARPSSLVLHTPTITVSKTASRNAVVRVSRAPYKFASQKFNFWYARNYIQVKHGWKKAQFRALKNLWMRESSWNELSHNSSSGAHGIPQAVPGIKMAAFGNHWRTNPVVQIKWGISYIKGRYGSAKAAWSHFQSHGWY